MKKNLALTALFAALIFSACSTDFQLESEWKDIPVVYAFLSVQDTAHYIRIEKAFLEPGGNAEAIARIADSLYYPEGTITVQLEKLETGQVYTLERVDGNLEGYPREAGDFAQAPNYLYKIRGGAINLQGGERVRLVIDRGGDQGLVTATTQVLEEVIPRSTSPSDPVNTWPYNSFLNFSWNAGESAKVFDLRLFIHYLERDPANPANEERKTLEWIIDRSVNREDAGQSRFTVEVLGEDFYRFMGSAIDDTRSVERIFEGFDIQIAAGGQELIDLNRVLQANTGITSSQAIPVYTNLSEGRGVFTSRYIARREGVELKSMALDSLISGIYTQDLNFRRP